MAVCEKNGLTAIHSRNAGLILHGCGWQSQIFVRRPIYQPGSSCQELFRAGMHFLQRRGVGSEEFSLINR